MLRRRVPRANTSILWDGASRRVGRLTRLLVHTRAERTTDVVPRDRRGRLGCPGSLLAAPAYAKGQRRPQAARGRTRHPAPCRSGPAGYGRVLELFGKGSRRFHLRELSPCNSRARGTAVGPGDCVRLGRLPVEERTRLLLVPTAAGKRSCRAPRLSCTRRLGQNGTRTLSSGSLRFCFAILRAAAVAYLKFRLPPSGLRWHR